MLLQIHAFKTDPCLYIYFIVCFYLLLNTILSYGYSTVCLSIYQWKDLGFLQFRVVMNNTAINTHMEILWGHKVSNQPSFMVGLCLNLSETTQPKRLCHFTFLQALSVSVIVALIFVDFSHSSGFQEALLQSQWR